MSVPIELVRELRKESGFPISLVRDALLQSGNCKMTAMSHLKKRAEVQASIIAGKSTKSILSLNRSSTAVVALKVSCETDFVSRTDTFRQFAAATGQAVADNIVSTGTMADRPMGLFSTNLLPLSELSGAAQSPETPQFMSRSIYGLNMMSPMGEGNERLLRTVKECAEGLCMKTGEKIALDEIACIEVPQVGVVGSFVHSTEHSPTSGQVGTRGAAVLVRCDSSDVSHLQHIADALAAQIAVGEAVSIEGGGGVTESGEGVTESGEGVTESGEGVTESDGGPHHDHTHALMQQEFFFFPKLIKSKFAHLSHLLKQEVSVDDGLRLLCEANQHGPIQVDCFFSVNSKSSLPCLTATAWR